MRRFLTKRLQSSAVSTENSQERSDAAQKSLRYYPALDGLRGLWSIMVFATHYGYFTAGWIPLECFFVLSGFLITAILIGDKKRSFKNYMGRFYWRRILRTFPAYFSFLLISCLLYALTRQPKGLPGALPSLAGYWYNFARLLAHPSPLMFQHLWSMSIEEQFYIAWPFVVFALSLANIRRLLIGIIVLTLFSKVALPFYLQRQGMSNFGIAWLYYFTTPLRLDAFGIGAAIAVFNLIKWTVRPRWVLLACFSALLLGLINKSFGDNPYVHFASNDIWEARFWGGLSLGYPLLLLQNKQYAWGYGVVDLVTGLLIISATQANKLQQLCANRPLVYLGRISYGFYIWHWPILVLMMPLLPRPWSVAGVICFGLAFTVALGVAHVSYFGFERHFLLLKTGFSRRKASTVSSGEQRDEVAETSNSRNRGTGAELAESATSIDPAGENSGEARHRPQEDRPL